MSLIDLTSYLGLAAVSLLTANILIGLLMSVRYNPWRRWPHRRINQLKLHNWTAYLALAIAVAHPLPLLFADKPRFRVVDVLVPIASPQQPVINTLGALALYAAGFTVVTSYYRAAIGRTRWKKLHYLTYLVAALFVVHGALTDQTLKNAPMDLLDGEKLYIEACGLVIVVASLFRARWALRRRRRGLHLGASSA